MREKSRIHRKIKKILIRASGDEKKLAEKLSKENGENTSQFFRRLLKEENERESVDLFLKSAEQLNKIAIELSDIIEKNKNKA
jgi:hypothetical protein